jgi:hypothetical protein
MFEPNVAELVFREMLAGDKNIRLIERHRITAAKVEIGGKERDAIPGKRIDGAAPADFGPSSDLVAVIADDLPKPGTRTEFRANAFIDATYEGDLAALSGVPYRVGRESKDTFKEPHAGKIYVRFGDSNPMPGSTGAADGGIQAFCFRLHLTKAEDFTPIEKPPGYKREDYTAMLADIRAGKATKLTHLIQLYPMPNGKYEVNSDHPHADTGIPSESLDLAEENWKWPEADAAGRAAIFRRYWSHNEGYLWTL